MTSLINRLIDASVVCLRCGTQGMGTCGCYERCGRQGCDWLISTTTDDACRNPEHFWPPRDVVCPHCGAEAGHPCLRSDGTPMTSEHARRKAASESVRRFTP
jgi:hypothetical protein